MKIRDTVEILDLDSHPTEAEINDIKMLHTRLTIMLDLLQDDDRTLREAVEGSNFDPGAFVRYLATYPRHYVNPKNKTVKLDPEPSRWCVSAITRTEN